MLYLFFFGHWIASVFFQSFFQHRYAAHRMYTVSPRTERVLHLMTYLVQGASYLSPRGYAILHRQHHAARQYSNDRQLPIFVAACDFVGHPGYAVVQVFLSAQLHRNVRDYRPHLALRDGALELVPRASGFFAGLRMRDIVVNETPVLFEWQLRESLSYDLPLLWPITHTKTINRFRGAPREDRMRFLERTGTRYFILPAPAPSVRRRSIR